MAIVDSWETFPDGQEHIVRTFCTVCGSQLEGGANVCFYCLEDQEEGEEEMTDKVFLLSAEEAEALPKYIRAYRFDTDSAKRTAVTRWNRRVGNLLFAALKGSLRRITQKGGQANE